MSFCLTKIYHFISFYHLIGIKMLNLQLNAPKYPQSLGRRGLLTSVHPLAWRTSRFNRNARSMYSNTALLADPVKIENLSTSYCDDFVCTTSPAIEQTVRSFARGLELLRLPPSLFGRDVEYSDGLRSFKGSSGYARLRFIEDSIQKPKVVSHI